MRWHDQYPHEKREKRVVDTAATIPVPPVHPPAPEPELAKAMREYLEGRGLDYDAAVRLGGWFPATFYGPRIIIPCTRTDGGVWWQARTMTNHPKRWHGCHGYRHDAVCFIPSEYERTTVIVEGPMCALAAAGLGYPSVAVLGAQPPEVVFDHVAKLVSRSYIKNKAIIVPDNDRLAGWQEIQQQLGARGVYGELRCVPTGIKDFADCTPETREELLR